MTTPTPQGRQRPRRSLLLGVVLIGLLVVLTTCVVAAQLGPFGADEAGRSGGESGGPGHASLSGSPTPEDSGPPATPWEKANWRSAAKKNQIIGVEVPPKPSASVARKDPLRVSVATLAALDSTNPSEWRAGVNPLSGYMSPSLAKAYTPPKASAGAEGEPDSSGNDKLPSGATASYEFYCHVASHTKKTVVSQCGYHVKTTSAGKVLRDTAGVDQKVTAKLARDGWRVSSLEPVTGPGGD